MFRIIIIVVLVSIGCRLSGQSIAFPGAEGFGKFATGGRGGQVLTVSTLADSGPGSLRAALAVKVPRIIVFAVSGTIHLESKLVISSNVTIAGQSAPGDGICLADYPVDIKGRNIIIRYLRIRMGDKNQRGGMVHGNGSDDALGGQRTNNLIVDHCSISWSTDEVFTVYAGDSTTLQWNLIAEPLNYSYHFEKGDTAYELHGFGGIWGGKHTSGHHNLFAHCVSRTPRFDGIRNAPEEFVDFTNNVIYNWGSNNVYAGEGGRYNIVNNYYRYGPSTAKSVRARVLNPYKKPPQLPYGKFYLSGNYVDGSEAVSRNNWSGVVMNEGTAADTVLAKAGAPFAAEKITMHTASDAYARILQGVGAVLPARDTLDQRVINDVINRTGRIIDAPGGFPHGTEYAQTISAWPVLRQQPPAHDRDRDGMPDAWERKRRLPEAKNNAASYSLDKQFTDIEVYLNELATLKISR